MGLPSKTTRTKIVKTGTVVRFPLKKNKPGQATPPRGSGGDPRMS